MNIPCECDISIESFRQLTSNLIYDVTPRKGRMLLILGHQPFKIYALLKVIYVCEHNIFGTDSTPN